MMAVALVGKKAAGRVVRVDDADYEVAAPYRWRVLETRMRSGRIASPYAMATVRRPGHPLTYILMHNLIMGFKGVDHVDRDGLNNQRSNLRPATASQNLANRRTWGRSPYKGVYLFRGKWVARIAVNHARYCLGTFASEDAAALAYNAAAIEAFGDYACLNQIGEPDEVAA